MTVLLQTVRRWWALIVVGALLAAAASAFVLGQRPPQYEASNRLLIGPVDADLEILRTAGLIALTYADLATSESHLLEAATEAGLPADIDALQESVTATANDTTRILTIQVRRDNPGEAAALADSVGALLMERAREAAPAPPFEPGVTIAPGVPLPAQGDPPSMITLIDSGRTSWEPLTQGTLLTILAAGVLGAVLAGGAALLLELTPWRVAPSNIHRLLECRYLGRVQRTELQRSRRRGLAAAKPGSKRAREYQLITTKMQHLTADRPFRSLVVCGAGDRDGSWLVAANLAFSFARSDRSVVIVDLTGSGALTRRLKIPDREHDVITSGDSVLEVADVPAQDGSVKILLSEAVRDVDGTSKTRHLIDTLGDVADLVIVAAPPLLLEYRTMLVAQQADGVVLIASDEDGEHGIDDAVEGYRTLEAADVRVVGTVLAAEHDSGPDPRAQALESETRHERPAVRARAGHAAVGDERHPRG